jgi:hypothetical protein
MIHLRAPYTPVLQETNQRFSRGGFSHWINNVIKNNRIIFPMATGTRLLAEYVITVCTILVHKEQLRAKYRAAAHPATARKAVVARAIQVAIRAPMAQLVSPAA